MNPTRKQRIRNLAILSRYHKNLWRKDEQGVSAEKGLIDAAGSTGGGMWIDRYPSVKACRRNKPLAKGDDWNFIMP